MERDHLWRRVIYAKYGEGWVVGQQSKFGVSMELVCGRVFLQAGILFVISYGLRFETSPGNVLDGCLVQ